MAGEEEQKGKRTNLTEEEWRELHNLEVSGYTVRTADGRTLNWDELIKEREDQAETDRLADIEHQEMLDADAANIAAKKAQADEVQRGELGGWTEAEIESLGTVGPQNADEARSHATPKLHEIIDAE